MRSAECRSWLHRDVVVEVDAQETTDAAADFGIALFALQHQGHIATGNLKPPGDEAVIKVLFDQKNLEFLGH